MLTLSNFFIALLLIIISSKQFYAQEPLRLSFIANEGFFLDLPSSDILIDALHTTTYKGGINSSPAFLADSIIGAKGVFSHIDYFLISHDHVDHFSPELSSGFMENHSETKLLMGNDCGYRLEILAEEAQKEWSGKNVILCATEPGMIEKVISGDTEISFFLVDHMPARGDYYTIAFLIETDGWRILHLADLYPESNLDLFKELGLDKLNIDLLFVDYMFLQNKAGQYILENYIKPGKIVSMHISPDRVEEVDIELKKLYPEIIIFGNQGESKVLIREAR